MSMLQILLSCFELPLQEIEVPGVYFPSFRTPAAGERTLEYDVPVSRTSVAILYFDIYILSCFIIYRIGIIG